MSTSAVLLALGAIIGVSSSLGYLLPAIIGLESMGVPSPGETALVLAAVLASQGKLQIWLVILIGIGLGDRRRQPRLLARPQARARRARRRRGRCTSAGSQVIDAGDRFFESTARRRCSSGAGSRWSASRPRGWPGSTRCGSAEFFF